ncbi:hypothetical protein [Ralstonia pseudosolanacearum]
MLRFLLLPRSRQNSGPAKRKTSRTPGFITNGSAACSQRGIGTPESATANRRRDAGHLDTNDQPILDANGKTQLALNEKGQVQFDRTAA